MARIVEMSTQCPPEPRVRPRRRIALPGSVLAKRRASVRAASCVASTKIAAMSALKNQKTQTKHNPAKCKTQQTARARNKKAQCNAKDKAQCNANDAKGPPKAPGAPGIMSLADTTYEVEGMCVYFATSLIMSDYLHVCQL